MEKRRQISGLAIIAAVIGLPLAGAWAGGRNLSEFFLFPPPLRIPENYPRFSWAAAVAVVAALAAILGPWLFHRPKSAQRRAESAATAPARPASFPQWGWCALGWTAAWWALAWTRLAWFAPLQAYTFFPLWLGFIVSVNALTFRRAGSCLMLRAPKSWLGLFAASAAFWWVFEWLNRFVQNWHFLGVENFGAAGYAAHGTLCFSTVLPAVAAVSEWLSAHPRWQARCATGPAWRWLGRPAGWALLAIGAGALVLTGARPQEFYPALWSAPLLLALGEEILARRAGLGSEIAAGDWRRAASWGVAALICGFFWEMWNFGSEAKWIYTVPYVDRWHFFEMPLLGYAGYLPFGLECLAAAERVVGRKLTAGVSA